MKNWIVSCFILAPSFLYAQGASGYKIKGKIGKVSYPAKVFMLRGGRFTDSTSIKNGEFELSGTNIKSPEKATLFLQYNGKKREIQPFSHLIDRIDLYIEPGIITINSPDSLYKAIISGTKLANETSKFHQHLRPFYRKEKAIELFFKNTSAKEQQSPEFAQNSDNIINELNNIRKQYHTSFIKAYPNSIVSLDALEEISGLSPQYEDVAPLYGILSSQVKNTPQGQKYGQMLDIIKKTSIGSQAPDFQQQTPDGKNVKLSDFRGKYLLIELWASWCGPCRAESPKIALVYAKYKAANFEVLAVSLDSDRDKWLKAIAEDNMPWIQVSDLRGMENRVAQLYNVHGIPQNYLIDPQGKIMAINLTAEQLSAKLGMLSNK